MSSDQQVQQLQDEQTQQQQQQQQIEVFRDPKRMLLEHVIQLQKEMKVLSDANSEKRKELKKVKEALSLYMKQEDVMCTSDVNGIYAQRVKVERTAKLSPEFIADTVAAYNGINDEKKKKKYTKKFIAYLKECRMQAKEETEVLRIKQTAEKLKETRASRPAKKRKADSVQDDVDASDNDDDDDDESDDEKKE